MQASVLSKSTVAQVLLKEYYLQLPSWFFQFTVLPTFTVISLSAAGDTPMKSRGSCPQGPLPNKFKLGSKCLRSDFKFVRFWHSCIYIMRFWGQNPSLNMKFIYVSYTAYSLGLKVILQNIASVFILKIYIIKVRKCIEKSICSA